MTKMLIYHTAHTVSF